MTMMLLENTPLVVALCAIIFAQILKVPIYFLVMKKWDFSLLTSTGGMPSSHSAAVASLATAVGFETSLDSPIFAVAVMFTLIVMYDASGVRLEAGKHATLLNELRQDFDLLTKNIAEWPKLDAEEKHQELKTLLGHKRSEVVVGALAGITLACTIYIF